MHYQAGPLGGQSQYALAIKCYFVLKMSIERTVIDL